MGALLRAAGTVKLSSLVVSAAALSVMAACGPPLLRDVRGRAITDPVYLAPAEYGWVAVDSSQGLIRAIIELQFEESEALFQSLDPRALALQFGTNQTHWPVSVGWADPVCWRDLISELGCSKNQASIVPGKDCRELRAGGQRKCLHVVRMEFMLSELPSTRPKLALGEHLLTK